MKKNDIALVVVVVIVAGTISLVFSNIFFGSPKSHTDKAPVVEAIVADFPRPSGDKDYLKFYNNLANNPTQLITVGDGTNTNPFNNSQ